jgi:hypothetical protein
MSLQEVIDERISFLKEQINPNNKPEVNNAFELQIDAIRSADIEKVEFIIPQKKALLKNCKDVRECDRLFVELDGLEWLQRQIARSPLEGVWEILNRRMGEIFNRRMAARFRPLSIEFAIGEKPTNPLPNLTRSPYLQYEIEVICLEDEPPQGMEDQTYRIPNPSFDNKRPPSDENPREVIVDYKGKRRDLWSKIREAETDFKKHRFIVGMEITTHILKTVGSFFLGPLLAVLAWLLLAITGTDDLLIFALVSFAIGLTTKTIITRVMNFVGERIADESLAATTTPAATRTDTSTTQAPSIVIDPNQARAGQLLSVNGNGFRTNSRITLEYVGNGAAGSNSTIQAFRETFQSSSKGEFGFRFWLPSSLPAGNYNISAKDEDNKSASEEFTVL